ncbi:hypothetical protein M413DRAFT_440213 [Hebeloma cylindrosporum]|uniref:UvrD-like helicase ATP-binding domain-containing protein n=1 Tax=Hebeloma cylindrosporum TaxID=76867 RepID=A0A0C3CWE1_HEBCY|nr:hypothetical protein M413DRAFT_440213 [Hebeloma cylindrosporum h7]
MPSPFDQQATQALIRHFDDDRLKSEDELGHALSMLSMAPESSYEAFLKQLLSPSSHITKPTLELVLAASECGDRLRNWLCENVTPRAENYSASLQALILERLSSFFQRTYYPFARDISITLANYLAKVQAAPRAIKALFRFSPRPFFEPERSEFHSMDDVFAGGLIKVKKSQRQRKQANRAGSVFDSAVLESFKTLGINPPDSVIDASTNMATVISEQLDILKFYLETLRDSKFEEFIRERYIFVETPETGVIESGEKIKPNPAKEEYSELKTPVAFPMVQPMKAALYFESAEGFGEWRILISSRADRDLREARRGDAKHFKTIIKKIKELSRGHFSDDNQKRLNGPNTEIPIYEAKMERDSRLIYQVDCIPEYDTDSDAQMDQRLWDSVGHQLARKGKEYRRRCIYRRRLQAGDNVFTPACFPAAEEAKGDDALVVPELPRESLEEMHSLLVLEKFVTLSQVGIKKCIIADMDVAHVFNVSPQEKEIVEHPYSCYVLGRSGTGKTTTMLFKMLGIQRAYSMRKDSMQKPRQLFVTQSRVLAGKVEEYFSKLLQTLSTADRTREELAEMVKLKKTQQDEEGLIDIDDDQDWRGDLPQRFSELQDEHFPLFVTFDRLASLLEADMPETSLDDLDSGDSTKFSKTSKLISYSTFLEVYWPHFTQSLKKGLDPALVFSELLGVIEGSEESLSHENHFLDKKSYENLSHRAQYAFANRRETIYAIFQLYLKQKKINNEYDAADRTHRILNVFQKMGVPGQKIDYLYVDEAQDNLLIDALLLRFLVRNPDGLFWAGDTAQTISVGSSFRFNDLKAFLFRLEKRREESIVGDTSPFLQEAPRSFQLSINYRSHGGIVQCADSVIALITEFWPYAIDALSRERGVVDGSKPVFFSGWDSDTVRYVSILVRNETARQELRRQVGDIGLIMTLYESKGLEFDDVLLYKFFEDSSVDLSQWRLVLNLLSDQSGQEMAAPRFDEIRHAGVCSELKFLYVAITRARKNLWLVDCSEKSEPMRVFWTSRNEIQNCHPGSDVPKLAVSSSPEEWEKSGRTLFSNKRYLQAMHCFERAGLAREAAVSHTYYLREVARSMPISSSKPGLLLRQNAFLAAAEAFVECSGSAKNAKEKKAYLRSAGDCFEHARDDYRAAQSYAQAEEYNTAVKLYRKCARFDEAVAIVTRNRQEVEEDVAENLIGVARLFYFKGGELDKAKQLFDSVEEQLEYLEDFDLDFSKAAVLENLGKFQDAAEIHLAEGRTTEAIRLFLIDQSNEESIARGRTCILQGLWEKASFNTRSLNRSEQVVELLKLASSVNTQSKTIIDPLVNDELEMFKAITSSDSKGLRSLGKKFASKGELISALICYDHYFSDLPNMSRMSVTDISELLADFLAYCGFLLHIANAQDPCKDPGIQKLFNIVPSTDNTFFLRTSTYLHERILASRTPLARENEQGVFVSESELARKINYNMVADLTAKVKAENDACRRAQVFNPCIPFITNFCNRRDCPRHHIPSVSLTREWYNLQVRIHLQQILVIQALPSPLQDKIILIRQWINRLSETFYPSWFRLGSIANFDLGSIPEAPRAFVVLKQWCLILLYWNRYRANDTRLLTTVHQVFNLFIQLEKQQPLNLISDAPLTKYCSRLPISIRKSGNSHSSIILELAHCLSAIDVECVSRGIFFVKHVIDNLLMIEANVLCQTIDLLCGSIILVLKGSNLHNINLPRSWLNLLLRKNRPSSDGTMALNINEVVIKMFVVTLGKVVYNLHMGQQEIGHLLVENSDLFALAAFRSVYIARICRTICLLGYNVNHMLLRVEIVKIMKAMRLSTSKPYNLYKDFVNAREWKDIARQIPALLTDSPLDEMVQVFHESRKNQTQPRHGIRRIIYKNVADVPRLLDTTQPVLISNLRVDAPEFIPKPRLPEGPLAGEAEPEQETEEPEEEDLEIIHNATSADAITIAALPDTNVPPSEERICAAIIFQTHYRKVLRLKRKATKQRPLDICRIKCFEDCLKESANLDWPNRSFYRLLFLGPLPHALTCLATAETWVYDNKKRNKDRFTKAKHEELEDLQKRLTEQKKVMDKIKSLQKALVPSAKIHRKRDVEELKKLITEVEALLCDIAPNVARDLEEDMALAMKGIVAPKRPPKPKPRPQLAIEDEAYDYEREISEDFGVELKRPSMEGSMDEKQAGQHVEAMVVKTRAPAAVIQSLPWVPVGGSEDEVDDSEADSLVMQSISWVAI